MGISTTNNSSVIRTDVWSQEVKDILQEELMMDKKVRWITGDFPDGDNLHIPTLSELNVRDYAEGDEITLDDANTGEFTLAIDKYYQAGFQIFDKFKEDSFYIDTVRSNFVGKISRALAEKKELDISALQAKQTAADSNTFNGAAHRLLASGTSEVMTLADIAKAKFALDKGNVSKAGRMAVVDPATAYQLVNIDNVIRQDVYGSNAHLKDGLSGNSFIGRYLGFDFYESNMLDTYAATTDVAGAAATNAGAYNMFLGEEAFIGAMRCMPDIESFRVPERKADAYHATIRYGLDLFRPESLIVIGANSAAV